MVLRSGYNALWREHLRLLLHRSPHLHGVVRHVYRKLQRAWQVIVRGSVARSGCYHSLAVTTTVSSPVGRQSCRATVLAESIVSGMAPV